MRNAKRNLERALDVMCNLLADHECPNDYDLAEWPECGNCHRGYEIRYDIQRDIDCWKKWALEKAEQEMK
jgi:hypothetical protein